MNYQSLTQVNYNDPLPKLGAKIKTSAELEKEAGPRKASESDWKPHGDTPGVEINAFTGQLRTNFALPEKEEKVSKVTKKRVIPELEPLKPLTTPRDFEEYLGRILPGFSKEFEKAAEETLDPAFELPGAPGWRTDTPKKPGVYFATNLGSSERIVKEGFKFKRRWDGEKWFTCLDANRSVLYSSKLPLFWNPTPVDLPAAAVLK